MTQPDPKHLFELVFPLVNRVITERPMADVGAPSAPGEMPSKVLVWEVSKANPVHPDATVGRIVTHAGSDVEFYSYRRDQGQDVGIRHTMPWTQVRTVEEVMDLPTLMTELANAERYDDDPPETDTPDAKAVTQ